MAHLKQAAWTKKFPNTHTSTLMQKLDFTIVLTTYQDRCDDRCIFSGWKYLCELTQVVLFLDLFPCHDFI